MSKTWHFKDLLDFWTNTEIIFQFGRRTLTPFVQLLKNTDTRDTITVTQELIKEVKQSSEILNRCCELVLRQSRQGKWLVSKSDEAFQVVGLAVLNEVYANQKRNSIRKT